jgi:hypothetical protein
VGPGCCGPARRGRRSRFGCQTGFLGPARLLGPLPDDFGESVGLGLHLGLALLLRVHLCLDSGRLGALVGGQAVDVRLRLGRGGRGRGGCLHRLLGLGLGLLAVAPQGGEVRLLGNLTRLGGGQLGERAVLRVHHRADEGEPVRELLRGVGIDRGIERAHPLFHVDLPGEGCHPPPASDDLVTGGGQLVLGLLLVRLGKFEVGCGLGIGGLGCRELPLGGGQGRLGAGDLGLGFLQGQVCRGQAGLGVVQVFTQLAQRRVDRPFLGIGIVGTGHRRHGDREKQSGDHSDTAEARGRAHPAYRLGSGGEA